MTAISQDIEKAKHGGIDAHPWVKWLMLAFGVAGLITVALILLGWMPLGERANILRSDRNWIEYVGILLAAVFSIASLRTFLGLQNGEKSSVAWAQWLTFLTMFIGAALILSVVIPAFARVLLIEGREGADAAELQVAGAGLLLSFVGVLGFMYQMASRAGLIGRRLENTIRIPVTGSLLLIAIGLLIAMPATNHLGIQISRCGI